MSLDPRRVLLYRDVVRAGSISAAARDLGWTQPAVSQHLAALERAVGCGLLIRSSTGVVPTEPGLRLLAHADEIAARLHQADEELTGFTHLRRGRVRLAAYPSAAATLVPTALARLLREHAGLDVELTEAEPPEAIAAVEAGDVDLALVFDYHQQPTGRGLTWVPLFAEPVDLVLPAGHRLAGRRAVRLSDLADEPWVVGCERCRAHVVERCAEAGFAPSVRHISDDYVVVQRLIALGLGVALLPRSALEAYRHPDVVVRSSRGFGNRRCGLVFRPGAEQVPATAALVRTLQS